MTTTRMVGLPEFEKHFRQYGFGWMMGALGRYSEVLVRELYTTYKGELQRQYL